MVAAGPGCRGVPADPGSSRTPLAKLIAATVSVMNDAADEHNRLGEYLRARRNLVTPDQVGIAAGAKRRVTGLRREEVALLAGISVDYYLRLERGRDRHPSLQVLQALSQVLRLDDVEREYLFSLATPTQRSRSRRLTERVPPRLHHLLDALDVPAFVEGRYLDVLASNERAAAFSPRLTPGHNRLHSLLLDPEEREFHDDWDTACADAVAGFRSLIGTDTTDARAAELVGELSLASARFRTLWARHDVSRLIGGTTTVNHPTVGPMTLHRDKLPVDDVLLVLYYPDSHSDSAEKLQLLKSFGPAHWRSG
jgi:transcriptional regulator with XRE-family HTH domain